MQYSACNHQVFVFVFFLKQVLASQFLAPPVLATQGPLIIIIIVFFSVTWLKYVYFGKRDLKLKAGDISDTISLF